VAVCAVCRLTGVVARAYVPPVTYPSNGDIDASEFFPWAYRLQTTTKNSSGKSRQGSSRGVRLCLGAPNKRRPTRPWSGWWVMAQTPTLVCSALLSQAEGISLWFEFPHPPPTTTTTTQSMLFADRPPPTPKKQNTGAHNAAPAPARGRGGRQRPRRRPSLCCCGKSDALKTCSAHHPIFKACFFSYSTAADPHHTPNARSRRRRPSRRG
jgi:hypothetical protein